jgi:hypothetical protein
VRKRSFVLSSWRSSLGLLGTAAVLSGLGCAGDNGGTPAGAGAMSATGATSGSGATGAGSSATGGTTPTGGTGGTAGSGGATGGAAGSSGAGGGQNPACETAAADAGAGVLRRLSVLEYQRTVQRLLGLSAPPDVEGIPVDTERLGFRTFAEFQTMSAGNLRAYLEQARELAKALMADATRRTTVLGCQPTEAGCLDSFVTSFGRLAFRRPLEQTEITGITAAATADAADADDQFRFAIEAMLSSPSFLFRVEVGDQVDGLSTLTPTELASRLSFGLLGRGPSAELLDQAASGGLDTPEQLAAAAASMLADPEAQTFFAAFFRQWLAYSTLRAPVAPPADWSDALLPAMQSETDALMQDHAWGGQSLLDALTANYTHVSPELATFYALAAPVAGVRLEFPAGDVRANSGLLTHASLLGAKSDGDLIAIRGNWLRRTFLCEELEPPPDLADQIGDLLVGLTRAEIVNKRNSEIQCRGCHAAIDPIGVGFAQFDATGRYDSRIDVSEFMVEKGLPEAPDPAFDTIGELSAKLKALPHVPGCIAERAFLYVNGREPGPADACTVDKATRDFAAGAHRFPTLLAGIVASPAFRLRRAPTPTTP